MATLQRKSGESEEEFEKRKKEFDEAQKIQPDIKLPRTKPVPEEPVKAEPFEQPEFLGKFTNIPATSPDAPELHESGRVWNPTTGKYEEDPYKEEKWQRISETPKERPPASAQVDFANINWPVATKTLQDKFGYEPDLDIDAQVEINTPHDASAKDKKEIYSKTLRDWELSRKRFESGMRILKDREKKALKAVKDKGDKVEKAKTNRAKWHRDLAGVNNSIAKLNAEALSPEEVSPRMSQLVQWENILKGLITEADGMIGDTMPEAAKIIKPVTPEAPEAQEYKTPEEIRNAFKAGTITREQAKQYYLQITTK